MKGSTPTKSDKAFWGKLASLGCIACKIDGHFNPEVSIHHIDGRTKAGAHQKVLPLCAGHHQDQGDGKTAVHPWRARFEAQYGRQLDLLEQCKKEIDASS